MCIIEKLDERGESARRHDINGVGKARKHRFDAAMTRNGRHVEKACGFPQESRFFRLALNEMDLCAGPIGKRAGKHQAGQAGA